MDHDMAHNAEYCKALYFAVFPKNISTLEFDFADFELLHCYSAVPKRLHGI